MVELTLSREKTGNVNLLKFLVTAFVPRGELMKFSIKKRYR